MRCRPIKLALILLPALAAGVVALVWSSQWWLPAIAPSLLGAVDVRVESARSVDGGRWRLEGLSFAPPGSGEVAIEYVELPNLWSYGRAQWDGREWQTAQAVELGKTVVRMSEPVERDDTAGAEVDWVGLFSGGNDALSTTRKWLPPLSAAAVRLKSAEGETLVEVSALSFDGHKLETELMVGEDGSPVSAALRLDFDNWQLEARSSVFPFVLKGGIRRAGPELLLEGELTQGEEKLDLAAVLSGTKVLPVEVLVSTSGFSVPVELLPASVVAKLSGLRIQEAEIKWAEDAYAGELLLTARAELEGDLVPVQASAKLAGDLERLRLQNLEIQSTWLKASLQGPLAFRDWTISDPAEFRFSFDLSKQPFYAASGMLRGTFTFQPPGVVAFEVAGDTISVAKYAVGDLVLKGRGDRSGLDIESMTLDLPEATPGRVQLNGRYDFQKAYLDFNYKARLEAGFLSEYAGIAWFEEGLTLAGEVDGDPREPMIRGKLEAGVVDLPQVRPLALNSEFSLQGLRSGEFDLSLDRETERIHLAVALSLVEGESIEGEIKAFEWMSGSAETLQLTAPVSFRLPVRGAPSVWFAETGFERLQIEGQVSRASLQKEAEGGLELSAHDLSPSRLNSWLEEPLPDVTLREAEVEVSALVPELAGAVSFVVEQEVVPLGLVRAKLADFKFGRRLTVGALELFLDGAGLLLGEAGLPIRVVWADGEVAPQLQVAEEGAIKFRARTAAPGPLSAIIEQWTGLSVESPGFEAELDGTLDQPEGYARARAASVSFDGFRLGPELPQPLPEIGKIDVELGAVGDRLQIESMTAAIRGGSVTAAGDWPLPGDFWRGGLGEVDWRKRLELGRFELSFAEWKLENWTPYLPDMLRRSGGLSGSVRYQPDRGLSGSVRFDDLALRATQNFPVVDSIRGEFRLDGKVLNLADATARVGGSPVSVTGELNWPTWPRVDWVVAVSGKNVPIVRRSDIILRSDLDLTLRSDAETSAAELSGRLGLRSSTMLVEFDPLSPPVRSGPSSSPPFFQVEETPFNKWGLDLRIEGEHFLRVRSPYFQSQISAGFDLTGSLGQPLLVGALRIEEGYLSFPGAKLRLDSGEAFIEAAQPNTLRLDLSGTARTGAHVITMQVGGSAAEPQVQFEASPPLPNTSIVRLLSTGSTTGGGTGAVGLYLGRGLLGAGGMDEGLGDRLTIDFGEETTRSGRSAFGMQFDIQEDLSLQGEYDVYDSYNMDLLWTIFEK